MQKNFLVLFDFDGTIADSLPLLIKMFNRVAPEFGCTQIRPEEHSELRKKRPQEFLKSFGVTWWKLPRVVLRIRSEMKNELGGVMLQNGIADTLKNLHDAGNQLAILTSNSEENVSEILSRYNIERLFSFIHSSKHLFGKHRVLRKIQRNHNGPIVYVGDETRDIEAAKKVGMPVVAVAWGFNEKSALEELEPDAIADHPSQLVEILNKLTSHRYLRNLCKKNILT